MAEHWNQVHGLMNMDSPTRNRQYTIIVACAVDDEVKSILPTCASSFQLPRVCVL